MPSVAIYALLAIGIFGGGFLGGYRVESWHAQAREAAAVDAAVAQYKAEAVKANEAAAALEQQKDKTHVVYQTITKTVDRIVERPVYRDRACLDASGLRAANAALAGPAAAAAGADQPVSRSHAP